MTDNCITFPHRAVKLRRATGCPVIKNSWPSNRRLTLRTFSRPWKKQYVNYYRMNAGEMRVLIQWNRRRSLGCIGFKYLEFCAASFFILSDLKTQISKQLLKQQKKNPTKPSHDSVPYLFVVSKTSLRAREQMCERPLAFWLSAFPSESHEWISSLRLISLICHTPPSRKTAHQLPLFTF